MQWAGWAIWKRSPLKTKGYDSLDAYQSVDERLRERIDLSDPGEALRTLRGHEFRNRMRGFGGRGGPGPSFGAPGFDRDRREGRDGRDGRDRDRGEMNPPPDRLRQEDHYPHAATPLRNPSS